MHHTVRGRWREFFDGGTVRSLKNIFFLLVLLVVTGHSFNFQLDPYDTC